MILPYVWKYGLFWVADGWFYCATLKQKGCCASMKWSRSKKKLAAHQVILDTHLASYYLFLAINSLLVSGRITYIILLWISTIFMTTDSFAANNTTLSTEPGLCRDDWRFSCAIRVEILTTFVTTSARACDSMDTIIPLTQCTYWVSRWSFSDWLMPNNHSTV